MAERLNAPDSKSGIPSRVSGVQIPLSPPYLTPRLPRYLGPLRGRGHSLMVTIFHWSGAGSEPDLPIAYHRSRRIAKETLGSLMQNRIAHGIGENVTVVGQKSLLLVDMGPSSLNAEPTAGSRSSPQSASLLFDCTAACSWARKALARAAVFAPRASTVLLPPQACVPPPACASRCSGAAQTMTRNRWEPGVAGTNGIEVNL